MLTGLKDLAVCLVNICRSPIGEAVFSIVAKGRDVDILVDSADMGHISLARCLTNSSKPLSPKGFTSGSNDNSIPQCYRRFREGALIHLQKNLIHFVLVYSLESTSHKARQVHDGDFYSFTHILAADDSNLITLLRKKPHDATAEVKLWGLYSDNEPIPDPFCGDIVSASWGAV